MGSLRCLKSQKKGLDFGGYLHVPDPGKGSEVRGFLGLLGVVEVVISTTSSEGATAS